MIAQPLLDLPQHLRQKTLLAPFLHRKDLIDEPRRKHLLRCDALTHDQRLISLTDPQPLHESVAGPAFRHQTKRREGRKEEGGGRAVYEIAEGDEGRGEADYGPVERGDEDFRVGVEGVCDFEVVGDEGGEPLAAGGGAGGGGAADCYVGAARDGG